ncbi:immunoglobulin domain-containing protein [Methanosarcina horonobensis]|uniref:immunoglobulin domain-containing protein n=1 Tax=Methanosarcina horonobensis TaxID=418008 RepID=UPI000AB1E2B5|nr:immunoglobulin domain-containing protein [Methanosarcina horonobensis]
MEKKDSKKSALGHLKTLWKSLPEVIKLLGTILSIAIALKVLFPASTVGIDSFDAGPEVIEPGELSVLTWEVSGATNITIEPDLGAVNSSGSFSVSPSETTTYKLMASGDGDEKIAMCTVTVEEEDMLISSFDASPDLVRPGESAVLNWHVSGVSNVTIEPGVGTVEPTGTLNVSPADTTSYKLTASNGDKEDTAYCTVTVKGDLPSTEENSSSMEENVMPQTESLPVQEEESSSDNLPSDNLPLRTCLLRTCFYRLF